MRIRFAVLVVAVLAFGPSVSPSFAQAPRPPEAYSLSMDQGRGMTINVTRDGSKEIVEQIVPPSANGPGMKLRLFYDLAAHKLWTTYIDGDGPCSVVAYTSPAVPQMFDPISNSDDIRDGLAKEKPVALRSETVNGIATKLYEVPVPEVKGKMRMSLEDKYNFAVKMILITGEGKEQPMMEVKKLSFSKPAPNFFVAPQGCQVVAGETNATGGHVEMKAETAQAGEVDLSKQKAAAPASRTAAPRAQAAPAATAEITEVRAVAVQPPHYTGPAPAVYEFSFTVTASGPMTAKYVLVNQANIAWAWGDITFTAAGSKDLKVPVKVGVGNGVHWEGSAKLEVVVGSKRIASQPLKVSSDCKLK